MRIAIASDDRISIAAHTGRCRGFVIFDISDTCASRTEYRENVYNAGADGSAAQRGKGYAHDSHDAHRLLADALLDCSALVARGMGRRLVHDLQYRGIDAFICDETDVARAARLFARGRLYRTEGSAGWCR
jgi:predicted Fe-Mo cluster-binding NifX family protein